MLLSLIEDQIKKHPLWRDLNEEQLLENSEELEKLLTSKLYNKIFYGSSTEEEQNRVFDEKLSELQWIKPEYLEIENVTTE